MVRKRILFGSLLIGLLFAETFSLMAYKANAEIAGMDAYDLRTDYDFKKAVKQVVSSSCYVNSSGQIDCY